MLENFKNMGKTIKQAKKMKDAMQAIQKELKTTVITETELDGKIKIEITGELEITNITIDPCILSSDQASTINAALKKGVNNAITKAKDIATNKLQSVTGGLFGS